MTLYKNQPVKYVTADGTIIDAKINTPLPPKHAHIEVADNHLALAVYNGDRTTPNTFHFSDEGGAAVMPATPLKSVSLKEPKPTRPNGSA